MQNENNDPIELIPGTKLKMVMSSLPQPTGPLCPKPAEPAVFLPTREVPASAVRHSRNFRGRVIDFDTGNVFESVADASKSLSITRNFIYDHIHGRKGYKKRFDYLDAA